jgi:hypothetical protein
MLEYFLNTFNFDNFETKKSKLKKKHPNQCQHNIFLIQVYFEKYCIITSNNATYLNNLFFIFTRFYSIPKPMRHLKRVNEDSVYATLIPRCTTPHREMFFLS